MICSGCGRKVSFSNGTCPGCGRSTNSDQQALALSIIAFLFSLMAGLFLDRADAGAAVGVGLAFAIQIVHRRLQRNDRPLAPP
jgi:hypothetical protein